MKQKLIFFWNSLAFSMIQQMLAIWSLVPLSFLNPVWISGSLQVTYYWSLAWKILSVTLLACEIAIRSSWPEPRSAPGLVYADCTELLHLWLQRIWTIWFQCWHLVTSMCTVLSCVAGRPACSVLCILLAKLLAFALFHFVLKGQTCLLFQVSLFFSF